MLMTSAPSLNDGNRIQRLGLLADASATILKPPLNDFKNIRLVLRQQNPM